MGGNRKPPVSVTEEIVNIVSNFYPFHTADETIKEMANQLGITICQATVYHIAKRHGIHKDANAVKEQYKKDFKAKRDKFFAGRDKNEVYARRGRTLHAIYEKEKWRESRGLERKTSIEIVQNHRAVKKRNMTKANLVRRNNYFPDEEDQRTLYYDEQTRRSKYIEERYKKVFTFLPAYGFDESQSVWVVNQDKTKKQ